MPEGAGPFAVCILVHGGGFTKQDKQTFITPFVHPAGRLGAAIDLQGFGAHTYERIDKPEGQFFHTEWPEVIG